MAKREVAHEATMDEAKEDSESGSESEGSGTSYVLNVDFEYFDPQEVDFHAIRNLITQLLGPDAEQIDVSGLSDFILSQPKLGSTIKVDGMDSDPYALVTVINLNANHDKEPIRKLTDYVLRKSRSAPELHAQLQKMLAETSQGHLGLVLSERLVNMPVQVVPPMYNMLLEEIQWAIDDREPYRFENYLVLSKTYNEQASNIDHEDDRPRKKFKKQKREEAQTFFFHEEDEVLRKQAIAQAQFTHSDSGQSADSRRAFHDAGIVPKGSMILLSPDGLGAAVEEMQSAFAV